MINNNLFKRIYGENILLILKNRYGYILSVNKLILINYFKFINNM